MKKTESPITVIVFIVLAFSFTVSNVYPIGVVFFMPVKNEYTPYRHGFPATYMTRRRDKPSDLPSAEYYPWPYSGESPLLTFRPTHLMFDTVVVVCLILLVTKCVLSWERRSATQPQLNIRQLMLLIVFLSCVLAVDRVTGKYLIFFARGGLGLISGCLVIISIPLSIVSLVQMGRAFYLRSWGTKTSSPSHSTMQDVNPPNH